MDTLVYQEHGSLFSGCLWDFANGKEKSVEMKTSASSFFCPLNSKKFCPAGAQAEGDFFVPPVLLWETGAKKELTKLDFFPPEWGRS